MKPLSIELYLNGHCIETAAKKELKKLTDLCFCTENVPETILKKIEMLHSFISKSDFPKLRAGDERLTGIREGLVNLTIDNNNNIILTFK